MFKTGYGKRIRSEGKVAAYADMVAKGIITEEIAAQALEMTAEQFKKAVEDLKVTACK